MSRMHEPYVSLEAFLSDWTVESTFTNRVFDALTDASLTYRGPGEGRSVGRLAWHITQSIGEMMQRTGLSPECPGEHDPVPATAAAVRRAYTRAAESLAEEVREKWKDDSLASLNDMYGETWSTAFTLQVLIRHQIHHRGQLTVLLRQAGTPARGVYGPAREEWAAMGMPPME